MEPEKKTSGALVGLVVIIIILVVGGVYIWLSNKDSVNSSPSDTQSEAVTSQDASALNALELEAGSVDSETGVDVDSVN